MTTVTPLPRSLRERFNELLNRLDAYAHANNRKSPKPGSGVGDSYMCCCPAHDDSNPSLSVSLEYDRILIHCFAGCSADQVAGSIGFPMEALFEDYRAPTAPWYTALRYGGGQTEVPPEGHTEAPAALPPSLDEFHAMEFPEPEPVLGPFTGAQMTLVYAAPGAGKSLFCMSLAHAMAEGVEFLGWEPSRPRRVLYVDGEMIGAMVQDRFRDVKSHRLFVANLHGWGVEANLEVLNLATEAGQATLNRWIEVLNIEVVMLDNFQCLVWLDGVSMSSDEIWAPIKRWCIDHRGLGRTVIVVDHANSEGRVFGTKTKTFQADLMATLEPFEEGADDGLEDAVTGRKVTLKWPKVRGLDGRDTRIAPKLLTLGNVGHPWRWASEKEARLDTIRKLRMEGLSIREIAAEIGVSKSTVDRIWKRVQLESVPEN